MAISIKSLSCGYGKNHVIHDVDFVAENQITAIIGANGSGKSTLLKSICGLCDIYGGEINLGKKSITGLATHKVIHLGVSYMAQRDNVFSDLSIHENLIVSNSLDALNLDDIFDMFPALYRHKKKKANDLSGGLRQLLAMAMIITKNPGVILFDEPTANLSPKNSKMILDKIRQIQKRLGNCVILVEQNVHSALECCDKVYLLAGGRVVYSGGPQKLLSDSELGKKYLGIDKL